MISLFFSSIQVQFHMKNDIETSARHFFSSGAPIQDPCVASTPPSSRCGSPSRSMTSRALPSFIGNASKLQAAPNYAFRRCQHRFPINWRIKCKLCMHNLKKLQLALTNPSQFPKVCKQLIRFCLLRACDALKKGAELVWDSLSTMSGSL